MITTKNGKRIQSVTEDEFAISSSEEAAICINCTAKKCKGDCKHFEEEKRKLKNGKNIRNSADS